MGAVLHLIHVLPPRELMEEIFTAAASSEAQAVRARAERGLQERAHSLSERYGVSPVCELRSGRGHEAILDASESLEAHLVVVGARGERDGVPLSQTVGDTALKLASRSRIATLLVRREAEVPYCHVVGCARAVPADRAVIEWANELSPADLIHIVSAYAVPHERRLVEWGASRRTLDVYAARERENRTRRLSELLNEFGLPLARARLHVERGEPVDTILQHAAQWHADVLIIGRRAEADRLWEAGQFGSIARQIAFLAPMDVMLVPPGAPPSTRPAGA
jgi:nucleotide-binding universal stress UspA family protein